jgi:hypothetical protein
MKLRSIILLLMCSFMTHGFAQKAINDYVEKPNPVKTDLAMWAKVKGINCAWGSIDTRYKKEVPPQLSANSKTVELIGWRGEQVSAQFAVWTDKDISHLSFNVSPLTRLGNGSGAIDNADFLCGFVRYVMTDGLNKDGLGGCGAREDATMFDSTLVADPIDQITKQLNVSANSTQCCWVGIPIPQTAAAGVYAGTVKVSDGDVVLGSLKIKLIVKNHVLPTPDKWSFHLDLWQNPFAVARYHGVPLWSNEHFQCMKPYADLYHRAGGKVITTSVIYKPWNGQTYDAFLPMITWMKLADGTWTFDYTIFDKWVEFMMSCGITQQINCYSMIPWKLSFQYFDQATNSLKFIDMEPGSKDFSDVWGAMLSSFAKHLKDKGWLGKTYIAMDERDLDVMKKAIDVIHKASPEFKIALAGSLHKELSADLDDYCVGLAAKYPEEMKSERKSRGQITTFYTCCAEPRPNTFTFCPPAEGEWMGWYAAKENLDGYLRWALNSWPENALVDSRFTNWAAGDTYLIYPGGRSSIRFERLIHGIQSYEKVKILRSEYKGKRGVLDKIQKALSAFDEKNLNKTTAAKIVKNANDVINGL